MSFNVNVDGRATNDINFVYTTSNISVDNISSDNFSTTNASIVNLSATTLQLQNLDLVRENVSNISVSNLSIDNGTATFLSSSVLIANSSTLISSIKNLSSNLINVSNINVCDITVPSTATIYSLNTDILNVNTNLNISNFDKFKDDNGSTIIEKIETRQANICVGSNLEFTDDEIFIKTMPQFINMCVKYDLNMVATSSEINSCGSINASNLCVSNGSFGNLTSTFINSSEIIIPSPLLTSEIYNLSSNKINSSILNVDTSLNISDFDKFKDDNGSTIIDKINTRQANICVGANLEFTDDEIVIKSTPEFTNLNVNTNLNISNFDKFKDDNGSTIIEKIETRQANICVGSNLEFTDDEIVIKSTPEFINLSVKYDLNLLSTSSRLNSSNISTNYLSVSNKLQATNISCTSLSVSVKLNAHNMSVKHISNLGAGSYLRSKNISATNLSVNFLHISSPLVLTNNILSSHAIINLSSKDQLKLGVSTLTEILDDIEIDTSNLNVGILNISEHLNLSILNSSINMVSGTTLNLSNSSQMLINGTTLHQLLNQTSATDLSVSSLTLLGTNTCVNINENGKLNVCNFNQIVDTNLCTLSDKLDDKQNTLSTTNELTLSSNQLGVNSIAQSKVSGLTNDLSNKQGTLTTSSELNLNSNNQLSVNSIAQSKVSGLTNDLSNKQGTLTTSSELNLNSNNQLSVNSIAHTKIGFANNGTIAFPSAFQLNFQGANGEVNMANGRIKNGTGGVVSLDINQGGQSYDGYINMHNNTCLNMCGNSNIRVSNFNQILKGSTDLQSTLNTYATTTALSNAIAPLVTTTALNTALQGYVTTQVFSNDMADKQTAIIGTDNIETYTYGTGSLAFSNIRLKSEINLTKINAQEVDFSDNTIDFDMVSGLTTAFQGKQNTLSLGTNLEFDVNTCNLQVKDEIHLTKINAQEVDFSDNAIDFDMITGLTTAFQAKQNTLSLGTNLEFDVNTCNLQVKDEIHITKINSSDVNFSDDSIAQVMINGLTGALSGKQPTLTLTNNLQFDDNDELDLHSNISVNNISLDINGTITDLGTYLTSNLTQLTGFFNISVRNGSIDTKRDINLSSLNVSDINVKDLQIILNGTFGMRNTQLPARKSELEITTTSFNLSTSGNLPIAFKITNTERMKLTPTELTLNCNLSQGQNYSANISNLTNNVMIGNTVHTSTLNASIINVSDLVLQVIDTTTINTRYLNSSYSNSCEGNFSDINGSDGNISECVIRTLTGHVATYDNLNSTLFNTCDITCDDFTLVENGIMKLETSIGSVRGQLTANSTKFSIGASSGQYITLMNANTEIVNIYDNRVNMNVSLNVSGKVNSSNFTIKNNNNELSIDANTNEFNMYSNGLPIHFNVNTNPFTTNNMEMTQTKNLMLKDLEMDNTVSANISTLNASTISVSTFNITQTSFTNLNASTCNASNISTDLVNFQDLEFKRNNTRLMRLFQDGTMTTLELRGGVASGSACRVRTYHNNGTYWDQESPVTEVRWKLNGGSETFAFSPSTLFHSGTNATKNLENDPAVLILRNPTSGYVGGHFGKFLRFTGSFYDGGSYNTYIMPRRGGSNSTGGMVIYDTQNNDFRVAIRQGNLASYNFYVNGNSGGASGWTNASDDRIKFNEKNINGLDVIRQLNPKKYDKIIQFGDDKTDNSYTDTDTSYNSWTPPSDASFNENPDNYEYIKEAGIIAQDLLQTDISFVVMNEESPESAFTPMSVDYNSIFVYAVQAIKELDIKVNNLETKVNHLESENDILRGLIQ